MTRFAAHAVFHLLKLLRRHAHARSLPELGNRAKEEFSAAESEPLGVNSLALGVVPAGMLALRWTSLYKFSNRRLGKNIEVRSDSHSLELPGPWKKT
ncbi:MAG: hypothetical protein ABIQ35_09430 [Verrucomicrobiota bacterium]